MDDFEMFRQKEIRITPESQVSVRYLKVAKAADVYALADGDILLVKHQITAADAHWLLSFPGKCTVFTGRPETLEALDATELLKGNAEVHLIRSVGLDYLHYGDSLLVFGRFPLPAIEPSVPNVVCIYPVQRRDIETQIAINMGIIEKALGTSIGQNEEEQLDSDETTADENPSEADLVRIELKRRFENEYSVIKAEFSGVSFENKTISLSEFYRKHGIANGRLKGNWRLFEKEKLAEIMDDGILGKARDTVLRRFTVSIPGYGRIVRVKDIEALQATLQSIVSDYRSYLDGDRECKRVGEIPIVKPFFPYDTIAESFCDLLDYLISICPVKELETESYIQEAKEFADKEYYKLNRFSEQVSMRITETSYKENQWKSHEFINCIWKAIETDRKFFSDGFVVLLERYSLLLFRNAEA